MKQLALFLVAALAEIGGCFAFWAWLRLDRSPLWLIPGMVSLAIFAWVLALSEAEAAGRTFAAYGGVYVVTALLWLRVVDGVKLSAFDWVGAGVALLGMWIIVTGWKAA